MKRWFQFIARTPLTDQVAQLTQQPTFSLSHRDNRTFRIAVLLSLLCALNILDLTFTLLAHHLDLLNEQNPIAQSFLSVGQEMSLISYKLLMLLVGCFLLWKLRESRWSSWACWLLVGVYTALGVVWYRWTLNFADIFEMLNRHFPAIHFTRSALAATKAGGLH